MTAMETLFFDLEKQLQFAALPLREWLTDAAQKPQYFCLSFLRETAALLTQTDFETAWQTAVRSQQYLLAEDMSVLKRLGTQLGKSDTSTQISCVRAAIKDAADNKMRAIENAQKASKLYVGLGTCTGMAIALLLI